MMKLFRRASQINHVQILAVIFLMFIFFVGATVLRSTLRMVIDFFQDDQTDIIRLRDDIADDHFNMLDYDDSLFLNKGTYINLNGFMARMMGQRYMNERVKLDNGHLASLIEKQDVTLAAAQMTKLSNKQKEKGKHFLMVMAPAQTPKYEDVMPEGYDNYTNQNADDLLAKLRENGVDVLDLREEMHKDGIDHTDAFFVTDHHWTSEAGFWAYTQIVDYLVQEGIIGDVEPMYTDISNYEIDRYEDWFLGSSGRRTGIYYAGLDDFEIITPKFDTDIQLDVPFQQVSEDGTFEDVAILEEDLENDYFISDINLAYRGASTDKDSLISYENEHAPTDLKILSIRDSFARTSIKYLALIARDVEELDMRHYPGSFPEYYNGFAPDVVIVMINAAMSSQENTEYDFFGDLR